MTTVKFRPTDIRVRYSDKMAEVVLKDNDPTKFSRKEISVNLNSVEDCKRMITLLSELGLEQHPSWTTQKGEFEIEFKGHRYTLYLQFIENFALF